MDLLIKNATIVTVNHNREVIENGSILIHNGIIKDIIKTDVSNIEASEIIDGQDCIVMPGWVNTHTHASMTIYRGLADDLPLMEWLQKHIWPAEAKYGNESSVRIGVKLAMYEMIQSGTTCFSDMYFFQDAVAEEASKLGMRVILGEGILDFPTPSIKNPDDSFDYVETLIKKWENDPLISCAVSPHAPYTVNQERLIKAKALADKNGVIFHTHLSETQFEVQESLKKHGKSPVEYLNDIGILDQNTVSAHCVHLSEKDIEIIQKQDMGVSHNPQSNMKLASGIAPIQKLLDKDVRVGIGTDGVASNNNLNMFEEVDMASKLSKVHTMDATSLDAETAIELGTIKGADILGLKDKIGSIEIGKQADLQIINTKKARLQPLHFPTSHIVYAMNGSEVRDVIINGRCVMRNRIVKGIDLSDLLNEVKQFNNIEY